MGQHSTLDNDGLTPTGYSDRIDRFLTEQMSPEESEAFMHDMESDEKLREEAQLRALMIKELQARQAEHDKEIIDEVTAAKDKARAAKKAKTIRKIRRALSIAAMFIVILGATWLWNGSLSKSDKLFEKYYASYIIEPGATKGIGSDVEERLAALFNQIDTVADLSPIIGELQSIYDSISSEYEYSLYAEDITWYLALAYLKDGNIDKAKSLLATIVNKGNYDVDGLLKKIECI